MNLSPAAHALIDYFRDEWEFACALCGDPVSAALFFGSCLFIAALIVGAFLG